MISWSSRKKGYITQITTKVEYIAASDANKEALCLINMISGLFGDIATVLFYVSGILHILLSWISVGSIFFHLFLLAVIILDEL
jgi:hypothetical protein